MHAAARWSRRLAVGGALVALGVVGFAYGHVRGLFVTAQTPAALDALLAPHDEIFRPEGPGPFPAVVFFHGCGGLRDSLRRWADEIRDLGVLVVATNSWAGRGLDWRDACSGRKLLGGERAGDVWVSFARVRAMPEVDATRVALMGWSHGAWSLMELFALRDGALPANLARAPAAPLADVRALILLYPYCGFAARARGSWPHAPPTLMLLAGEDSVVSAEACAEWGDGRPGVETHVYPGVGHGFDQAVPSGEWRSTWDESAGNDARRRVAAFLRERLALAPGAGGR